MAIMSAAPQKKAKTEKSKATLNQEVIASTTPQVIADNDSLGNSWTDRPDSLRMLVECAALLGISDTIDPEGSGSSADKLASRAVDLINACEFSLKKETMQAEIRVKEQISRLQDLKDFSTHLSFEAGAKALLKIDDDRQERLDAGIKRLLKADFESKARFPRSLREYRHLAVFLEGENPQGTNLEHFIDGELSRYHAKGFAPEDLKHLSAFRSKRPADKE
jgi:hypothetical protein